MKNLLYLLLCFVVLSACAKKTHLTESSNFKHNLKTQIDSSARKVAIVTDKTVTIINRSIDTNIIVTGTALTGYLHPSTLMGKDANAHFENEDLNLFLRIDKTGKATATAIPKTKIAKAKAFEQTTIYNDVIKKEETEIHAKSDLEVKTSLSTKQTQKETKDNTSFSFSLIIALLSVCALIWVGRKFLSWGKIFGNT